MNEIKKIIALITKAPTESMRLELAQLLFTADELSQLEARYAIIKSLFEKEESQRELAARLGLSIAKITRGSHALRRISPKLRVYLGEFFHE
jgi:TrpR family trp operon transcriptional repressor